MASNIILDQKKDFESNGENGAFWDTLINDMKNKNQANEVRK